MPLPTSGKGLELLIIQICCSVIVYISACLRLWAQHANKNRQLQHNNTAKKKQSPHDILMLASVVCVYCDFQTYRVGFVLSIYTRALLFWDTLTLLTGLLASLHRPDYHCNSRHHRGWHRTTCKQDRHRGSYQRLSNVVLRRTHLCRAFMPRQDLCNLVLARSIHRPKKNKESYW